MKFIFAMLMVCIAWVAQADWRATLISLTPAPWLEVDVTDPAHPIVKDDGIFNTLDRALQLERNASPEDAPYLKLHTTFLLSNALYDFQRLPRTEKTLPDLTQPSQSWSHTQANELLKVRLTEALKEDVLRFAHVPSALYPVLPISSTPSWPNQSALSKLLPLAMRHLNLPKETYYPQFIAWAQAVGDLFLEGALELEWLGYQHQLTDVQRMEALKTLDKRNRWPRDIRAMILLKQAQLLHQAEDLEKKYWLLCEARSEATLHQVKAEAAQKVNQLRQASFEFPDFPLVIHPKHRTLTVHYRNTQKLIMTFTKPKEQKEPLHKTYTLPKPKHPYASATTEITLPELPLGEIEVTITAAPNFRHLHQPKETLSLHVGTYLAAKITDDTQGYIAVVDSLDGTPVPGAVLYDDDKTLTADADGLIPYVFPRDDSSDEDRPLRLCARGESLQVQQYLLKNYTTFRSSEMKTQVKCFTDRALYRPGETLNWELLILHYDPKTRRYLPTPKTSGALKIKGRADNGDTCVLVEANCTTTASGTLADTLKLPDDFKGFISFEWERNRVHSLPVVAYRAPTFTMTLQRDNIGAPITEPLQFSITAHDLSGTPLQGATAHWRLYTDREETPSGEVTLDETGKATLKVTLPPADSPESKDDLYGYFEVILLNSTGERQTETLSFRIPPFGYDFFIDGATPTWCFDQTPFTMTLQSDNLNATGTLCVYPAHSIRDAATTAEPKPIQTYPFKVGQPITLTLPTGEYDLKASSGPITNDLSTITVWPREHTTERIAQLQDGKGILLVNYKNPNYTFSVGENVECYAALPGAAPCYRIISTRDGISRPERLDSPFFTVPVTQEMCNGFVIEVYTIWQGALYQHSQTCAVTPPEELKVEATRFSEKARPGSEQTWEITVNDPTAELIITCYDTALEALAPHTWQSLNRLIRNYYRYTLFVDLILYPYDIFWSEQLPDDFCDPHTSEYQVLGEDYISLSNGPIGRYSAKKRVFDAASPRAVLGSRASGLRAEPTSTPNRRPRSDFRTSALWLPQVKTKNGKATFTFTLPDSLTTWRLQAFAFTADGRSGVLRRDCTATQEIKLNPYLPRTLHVGDRLTLAVRVDNTADTPCEQVVTLNEAEPRPLQIPAKGYAIATWEVEAKAMGPRTFRFACEGDAAELKVPVLDDTIEVEDVYPMTLVDTTPKTVEVALPTPDVCLKERWDHQPGDAVTAALKKQLDYPFNCAEQTFAKLQAAILLGKEAPEGLADRLLKELLALRTSTKLWPWFAGGRDDVLISSAICIGTARLYHLGCAPEPLVEAVRETLTTAPNRITFPVWAYCCATMKCWPEEVPTTDRLAEAYQTATRIQERRLITVAAQRLGVTEVAKRGLKEVLAAMNTSEVWGRYWPQERLWWNWWHTPIESHVLGWEVLREAGETEAARGAALWLLQHRRLNAWGSTRATADAAYALISEGLKDQPLTELTRQEETLPKAKRLTFARQTPGITFGGITATYRLPLAELPAPPVAEGAAITLKRTLSPATPKVGDTVTVTLTLNAAQPMSHLHITSPRPANAEPVNTLPFWDRSSGSRVMPGDSGSDLFIGTLQRGITTIQYTWKITHAGDCVVEPARATLMYAPDFAARTEATRLTTHAK